MTLATRRRQVIETEILLDKAIKIRDEAAMRADALAKQLEDQRAELTAAFVQETATLSGLAQRNGLSKTYVGEPAKDG